MNISLRDVIHEDLPTFYLNQKDPTANAMAAYPARDEVAFFEHWTTKVLANETGIKKTILVDNHIAGNIVCWNQDEKWLIGYWIGREYWGKGIASGALSKFLAICTHRPLYAYVIEHNKGSIRVLEKCGFTLDGRELEELLFICK